MAFKTYGVAKNGSADKPKVDYDAINQYRVDTAGLEKREVLVGYISVIVTGKQIGRAHV